MHKRLFLILGLLAILALGAIAQNDPSPNQSGPNLNVRNVALELDMSGILEADDDEDDDEATAGLTRPRVVKVWESKVKSSVAVNIGSVERTAFDILNQKRRERGLQPLTWSADLCNVARLHSENMSEFQFFAHRGLDGKMVSDRADDSGLGKWRAIGENIAFNRGYQDPIAKAVEGWLDSPTHMRNLMDDKWKESAIGVAVAEDGSYYFTQVFLVRK